MNAIPLIITIDGPAGVGKTTLARKLADSLDIAYLDTGAMFRAVGLILERKGCGHDQEKIKTILAGISFGLEGSARQSSVTLNNSRLGPEIRTEEVGMLASRAGQLEVVRDFLKETQQRIGGSTSLVAEGRDMGSVVFPGARYKFFLDASPRIRAERRVSQLESMGIKADYGLILAQMIKRDEQDRTRAIAPLRPAPDAYVIDTGKYCPDGVLEEIHRVLQSGNKQPGANA